ncbi:MAG: tetratricopeptide repeat protein [Gemmatimonadota bacterium]|jgi:tetratricopeptide (TPR) repeat protein|nr:tetratricopeptide repeat protein [Gemmatimonadota bacterium]
MGIIRYRGVAALVFALLLPVAACAQQDAGSAAAALTGGRYDDAIRIASADLRAGDAASRETLVRALLDVGRYDEAVEAAEGLPLLRGEAHFARGRLTEADAAFAEAVTNGGADRLTAELRRAEILWLRGNREEARTAFNRFIDVYNRSDQLPAEDLTAVGNAVWYLGGRESALFQDAVLAFDQATRRDPRAIEPHIRLAELFIEKYSAQEAADALGDALAINPNHPRALLAKARLRSFENARGEAMDLVGRALQVNPNLVPALLFRARMNLDTENWDEAEKDLHLALEVNPSSLEGLSTLAALHYVRNDQRQYREVSDRVRSLNPGYAGLLTTVAEIAAQVRLYRDAADLAAQAVELDPESWSAYSVLGLNLFRTGRIEEAKAALNRSFAGDPYNVWIKNNLDLLDTFREYEVRSPDARLSFMLRADEADLLYPYAVQAATEALESQISRYGMRPRGSVRVEFYPRSADFSVRTVGLAGLGALGVSFGDVLALDAPSAREPGSYNWLTTLWHEMGHTVALEVSGNRVPRWLTEGMSVVEERYTTPGWTPAIAPEFIVAYDEKQLPPVSRLNEGFIRPPTPQHLSLAYQMASLVVEWIQETRGFSSLITMLRAYNDGQSTAQVLEGVLGASPERIDEEFDRWLRNRADPAQARAYLDALHEAGEQVANGENEKAVITLNRAKTLFPPGGGTAANALLARLQLQMNDEAGAIESLAEYTKYDENAYRANLELAGLLNKKGDSAGALLALDRAVWIYPYELEPHQRLADLASAQGNHTIAVRERRAVIGLRPTDMAGARYQLAEALLQAGQRDEARVEVLRALEIAPGYAEAQQLLLRLHEPI